MSHSSRPKSFLAPRLPQRFLSVFRKPLRESLVSVLPIMGIVTLLCFVLTPVSNNAMMAFLVGGILLILGMGLFTMGSEMSMIPLGEYVGKEITSSRKISVIVLLSFLIGVLITVAEPDLQVLAEQVPSIPNNVIIWSVALGVGVFLVIALLRILFVTLLGAVLGSLALIPYGFAEDPALTLLSAAGKALLGAAALEAGICGLGLPEGLMWLLLWLLLALTLATRPVAYQNQQSRTVSAGAPLL